MSVPSPHLCPTAFWRGGNVAFRTKQTVRFYKDYRKNSKGNWVAVARNLCSYPWRERLHLVPKVKEEQESILCSVTPIHWDLPIPGEWQ